MNTYRRFPFLVLVALLFGFVFMGASSTTVYAAACTPLSPNDCGTIPVNVTPQFCLTFNGTEGGLSDKTGTVGTGFTMVEANSVKLADQNPIEDTSAPSYKKSRLEVISGELRVTSNKGINIDKPPTNSENNSMVNALGVGFNATRQVRIEATLNNLNFDTSTGPTGQVANGQQAGIRFALDEDNYVKLVVAKTGVNTARIELANEKINPDDPTKVIVTSNATGNITNISAKVFKLTLELTPASNSVKGMYSIDNGAQITVSTHTVPAEFFTGRALGTLGNYSYAGIMATHRRADADKPFIARYADFCVKRFGNIEPQTQPDNYSVNEDTTLNVASAGVLANDSDPDSPTITAVKLTDPANGTLTLNANGSFKYIPNPNFFGTDTFTYAATDGPDQSDSTTVTITVNSVLDIAAAADDAYAMLEDTTLDVVIPGVLANDSNPDSSSIRATLVNSPTWGNLNLKQNGSFTYTPLSEYSGQDSFTYQLTQAGVPRNTATVTLTITAVNDAPFAGDDTYEVLLDQVLTVDAEEGVLANDIDADDDPITVTGTASLPQHGDVVLNADGSFVYTPDTGYIGVDAFIYTVTDGNLTDTAEVSILVNNASLEVLSNGSFERKGNAIRDAQGWKGNMLLSNDKRMCNNKNHVITTQGKCAFRFNFIGKSNFTRSISQTFATPINVQDGDSLTLFVSVDAKTLTPGGRAALTLFYKDGTKGSANVEFATGTYDYTVFSRTINLARDVKKVKISILYSGEEGGSGGVMTVDGVSLQLNQPNGAALTGANANTMRDGTFGQGKLTQAEVDNINIIPLPAAPADLRGQ